MSRDVDILCLLPDVAAIGRNKLQAYCNQWLKRPIAQEFGITHLIVGSDLMLSVNIDDNRARFDNDRVFIPIDELAAYIIDEHFQDAAQRRELHAQLRALRKRWNEIGYQYEAMSGRVGSLWITCKNPACGIMLETAQEAIEGQTISCPPRELTCPECGVSNVYDGSDLKVIVKD